jgi:hypothetical protein
MKRLGVAGIVLAAVFLTVVGAAWGEATTTICVPEAASKPVLSTNAKGECSPQFEKKTELKYKSVQLPGSGELETLNKILPHVNYVESGVAGKPTIQFSGVNVQVVSGTNAAVNGEGNLVIGYDENPGSQTGSHNLILGTGQTFTSYGGLLGGSYNATLAPYASVSGGRFNLAFGEDGSVSGGEFNEAGSHASVSGGTQNRAEGDRASISGGRLNNATATDSSVSGGELNNSKREASWVGGGWENSASAEKASVTGGAFDEASGEFASVGGGFANKAEGKYSSVFGGKELIASNEYEAIP